MNLSADTLLMLVVPDSTDTMRGLKRMYMDLQGNQMQLHSILKAVGYETRLQILLALIEQPLELEKLGKQLQVKTTTLSNQLQYLLEAKLVNKLTHGTYQLTDTGFLFLESLQEFSLREARHRQSPTFIEQPDSYFKKPTVESITMQENTLSTPPTFTPAWLTLAGAFTGIFQQKGEKFDLVDVLGYSGYGFVACMTVDEIQPSPPTAHPFFTEVHEGIESMGYELFGDFERGAVFPGRELSMQDEKRLISLFEQIKERIDKDDPVILWGPAAAEFAIVTGYTNDAYQVSSYRTALKMPEDPVHYKDLQSPGGLWWYYLKQKTHTITEEHDRAAIIRALTIARGREQPEALVGVPDPDDWKENTQEFVSGPDAFRIWQKNLEAKKFIAMGNAYCMACYAEGHRAANQFLERLATKYTSREFATSLQEAAGAYAELAETLESVEKRFPFPGGKETEEDLAFGAAHLGKCAGLTEKAIVALENVLKAWTL